MHMAPGDSLLGRVWREIQRGTLTVIAIDKVKSLFAVNRPKNDKYIDLGSAKLQLKQDEESRAAQSVAEYYQRLRVLMNAYSVAGTFLVESKTAAGAKVYMAPLAVLLNYCDAALRHATDFQVGVDWVKQRDEQCRARVVELSRQKWPVANNGLWERPSSEPIRSRNLCGCSLRIELSCRSGPSQTQPCLTVPTVVVLRSLGLPGRFGERPSVRSGTTTGGVRRTALISMAVMSCWLTTSPAVPRHTIVCYARTVRALAALARKVRCIVRVRPAVSSRQRL